MAERQDPLQAWRHLLEAGDARAEHALARALAEDPSLVRDVVPLAFSKDQRVRSGTLRALARFAGLRPEAVLPFIPTILDAAAAAPAPAPAPPSAPGVSEDARDVHSMEIRVTARAPRSLVADDSDPEGEVPGLLYGTLAEMFHVLLNTGWTPDVAQARDPYQGWKTMPVETMEDILEGVVYLLEVVYRDGDHSRPWNADEVFEVLLKRAIPLAIPLVVHKVSASTALVEAGAPQAEPPEGVAYESWPSIVGPFVQLVGHYVHPGFTFVNVRDDGKGRNVVRFLASTAEATPRTA